MSTHPTIRRPSDRGTAVLPAERYIPKVTNIDPDISVRRDRREARAGWAANVPVLKWFLAR